MDGLPGDERCRIRAQKQDHVGDFFRLAQPPLRNGFQAGVFRVPRDISRAHRIHAHAQRREFASSLFGEADHTRLAGDIPNAVRAGQRMACRTRHIDDHATAFVRHHTPRQLRDKKSAIEVHIQYAPPIPFIQLDEAAVFFDTGCIHHNIDALECIAHGLDHRANQQLIGDIRLPADCRAACCRDEIRDFICAIRVEVIGEDARACISQRDRRRPADALARARDQRALSSQVYAKVCHRRYSITSCVWIILGTMKRKIYLEDLPLDDAWERFTSALEKVGLWEPLGEETIPLSAAAGRVTAQPIWATISAPHYHASAMDGYAVRAADTVGASETHPLTMTLISDESELERVGRPMMACNTGHPLPGWANAVIMIENVQSTDDDNALLIRAAVAPWQHIRAMGEDMVATELVLPANHVLRPVDIGAIAGSGHAEVTVRRQPRAAIIPTGSELITSEDAAEFGVQPGQIIEFNSLVLAAQIDGWGGRATRFPPIPDDFATLKEVVGHAATDHDLVLVNAGSSAGSEDFTAHVVDALGEVLVHGIAVRPGHPVIFGIIKADERAVPVIGVPGYPVSAALTGEIFIERLLSKWLGKPPTEAPTIDATISRKVLSPAGDDEYLRVTVGQVGAKTIATPLARGAGVISSLVRADGIVRIPRFSEGLDTGDGVTVHLYRQPAQIKRTIVAIGSHDMTLDLLAQFLAERAPGSRLASANVGSLGGLIAIRRGEAHLGGAHLLDPETGDYNLRYVDEYLPDADVVLVTLAGREQGLMVAKGNPKGIQSLANLAQDVRFVNRQRGSGTRILLDYELAQIGLSSEHIDGYTREEFTHLAVAADIASGTADCGLGIRAAANALDLDFVPITEERYDLVIPRAHFESDLLAPLLDILHDAAFRAGRCRHAGLQRGGDGSRLWRGNKTCPPNFSRC